MGQRASLEIAIPMPILIPPLRGPSTIPPRIRAAEQSPSWGAGTAASPAGSARVDAEGKEHGQGIGRTNSPLALLQEYDILWTQADESYRVNMMNTLTQATGGTDRAAHRVVDQLARLATNVSLYGLSHRITREYADNVYLALTNYLHAHGQIELGLHEESLLVDGQALPHPTPVVRAFAARLTGLNVSTFTITRGLDIEDFLGFFALIAELSSRMDDDEKDFAASLERAGLKHVQSDRAVYRRITADQKVVDVSDAEREGESEEGGPPTVDDMNAFVEGKSPASINRLMERIREGDADEAQHIADLVVDTIAMRQEAGDLNDPDALREVAASCLRKVYGSIIGDDALKTRKGRRHLRRVMAVMEKHIVVRLKALTGADPAAAMREVQSITHDLCEAIKVDDLVDHYIKRRQATRAAELDLERLIRRRGAEVLKQSGLNEQLSNAGMALDSWYIRNVVPSGATESEGGIDRGAILGVMLQDLSETAGSAESVDVDAHALLQSKLEQVEAEVAKLMQETVAKIDEISKVASEEPNAPPERERGKRRTLVVLLAEVVQEFCQPLSVITCALDILKSKHGLSMNETQRQATLELAYESTERLQALVSQLGDAAGVPEELNPDIDGMDAALKRRASR